MSAPQWQYRLYYGYDNGPNKDGWTEWENVRERTLAYSPRTLLEDITQVGQVQFRKYVPTCDLCDAPVEDHGLCDWHLNQAYDGYLNQAYDGYLEDDPWPDFHDEPVDGDGGHWGWDTDTQTDRFYRD